VKTATQESLLLRLQDIDDAKAWDRFHETYGPFIYNFACKRGCNNHVAQDVLQETLITFSRIMPEFSYDPMRGSFRSLLMTVVKSRVADAFRREKKQAMGTGNAPLDTDVVEAEDPWLSNWEHDWNREWEQHLLLEGLKRVKNKVKPHVLESFRRYVLEGQRAEDVAAALGIPEANIYNQKRRVLTLLQKEIAVVREELGE